MHFVGNKAIYLGNGEQELQITFSTLFTVISFFVPIVVLLIAFITIGTSSIVSWIRVSLGGFLCGSAICGMHYLGNASIENYTCNYNIGYIVGSAIIAIAASIIALSAFFIFRSTWANTWWKRLLSALLLAGAVSGMHWCAAFGTEYTLISIKSGGGGEMSQEATAVVVICLVRFLHPCEAHGLLG
jgi:NO-binding membrane sensor protein with MHYT domain